jgi:hypothetical protein
MKQLSKLTLCLVVCVSSIVASVNCYISGTYHWLLSLNGLLLGTVSLLAFLQSYDKFSD